MKKKSFIGIRDLWWLVIDLGVVAVLLATHDIGKSPFIVNYLTVGSAITSIVLAIVAIFITSLTANANSSSLAKLEFVSDELNETKEEIRKISQGILSDLQDVPKDVKGIHSRMAEFSEQIKGAINTAPEQKSKNPKPEIKYSKNQENKRAEALVDQLPLNGLVILYACILSYKNKTEFDLYDFQISLEWGEVDYYLGVMVVLYASGFIDYSEDEEGDYYKVEDVSSELMDKVKPALEEAARGGYEKFKDDIPEKDDVLGKELRAMIKGYKTLVKDIEKYFT